MKKSLLILLTAAVSLSAAVCFADSTATIVNKTNFTCTTFPTYSPSSCTQSGAGSTIQAANNMQPVGNAIAVGASGPAPIYSSNTIGVIADNFPASFIGASAGKTYYVVSNSTMGGPAIVKTAP